MEKTKYLTYNQLNKEVLFSKRFHDVMVGVILNTRCRLAERAGINYDSPTNFSTTDPIENERALRDLSYLMRQDMKLNKFLPKYQDRIKMASYN